MIYNVTVTYEATMVVIAEDADHAFEVAYENAKSGIEDSGEGPSVHVTGEITAEKHLRDGWDVECVPYGGDGNTRIGDYLK